MTEQQIKRIKEIIKDTREAQRGTICKYVRHTIRNHELLIEEVQKLLEERIVSKIFETFEEVEDMRPCMKRPIIVHAKQMKEPFRVDTLEGNYKYGKHGDYLMRGIEGELYICDREIFEKSYDFKD